MQVLTDVIFQETNKYVIKKEAEEILRYKNFAIEIQCKWDKEAEVIPVITEAAGSFSESFRQYLSNIPGKHESDKLQNSTAHVIRKYYRTSTNYM
jgi:hypothetical protein